MARSIVAKHRANDTVAISLDHLWQTLADSPDFALSFWQRHPAYLPGVVLPQVISWDVINALSREGAEIALMSSNVTSCFML